MTTQHKPIKRTVTKLDTSGQLDLFTKDVEVETRATRRPGRVCFIDPAPTAIKLGEQRLDEHLKAVKERNAFVVRKQLEAMDFSEFEASYSPGGRPPYAPRSMLGIILYGIMKGISSLRDLEKLARIDLGCMWVSGGIYPDHSILGRFIQRHEDLLSDGFLTEHTRSVLQATHSDTEVVAGDGTIVEAATSNYQLMKAEALREKVQALREQSLLNPEDQKIEMQATQHEHALDILESRQQKRKDKGKPFENMSISPIEPDAPLQPLKDKKRFAPAYKPSVLANDKRVIVAQGLHGSSETRLVPELLDEALKLSPIHTALFDAGYHCDSVIEAHLSREIELLCPQGQSYGDNWNRQSGKSFLKNEFTYDADSDTYRCPRGETLMLHYHYKGNDKNPAYRQYRTSACQGCPLKAQCTKSEKGRQIKRYEGDTEKEALQAHMADEAVRKRYIKRQAMVEPVFSFLKRRQGLTRFRRMGLKAVSCEFALHVMAYNMSRVVALCRALFFVFYARLMLNLRHSQALNKI